MIWVSTVPVVSVADVEWSPYGHEIILGIKNNVLVYNILTRSFVNNISIGDTIKELSSNPKIEEFAIATSNGSVIIWDHLLNSSITHLYYDNPSTLSWSKNGSLLVLGTGNEIRFLKEGSERFKIQDIAIEEITNIALNQDENLPKQVIQKL